MRRALSFVAVAGALAATGCTSAHPPPSSPPSPRAFASSISPMAPPGIDVRSHGQGSRDVTFTQVHNGKTSYIVHADSSDIRRSRSNEGVSTFVRPFVTFYESDGKTLLADSPRAQMSEQTQTIVMLGGVHARTSDGGTLTCDRLTYDAKHELVHGRGHVVFVGAHGERATGSRIDANLRLSDVRMSSGAEDGP